MKGKKMVGDYSRLEDTSVLNAYVYVCMYVYTYMYVCVRIYVCIEEERER